MSRAIRVLYVHPVGYFGGASRSLLEMVKAFPVGSVEAFAIAPRGDVPALFAQAGITVFTTRGITQFDNTQYGAYRGRRWLLLLREGFHLLPTLEVLWRVRRQLDVDVIHINEITVLFPVWIAKRWFKKPIVVHVRSLQNRTNRRRINLIRHILKRYADQVVAIDETVSASLPPDIERQIVHNGFVAERNSSGRTYMADGVLRVVMVGNLLPMKGVYEFISAAAICRENGIRAEFVLVGHNTRKLGGLVRFILSKLDFARDVEAELKTWIAEKGLEEMVKLRGFTTDISQVYAECDVVCFPSHLDAVGRPVIEAAFSRVPSIVAIVDPKADTLIDGETGICIPPRNAEALAAAVAHFYRNPAELGRMGDNAYQLAMKNFDIRKNAATILGIYQKLSDKRVQMGSDQA